jgi:hypothetical protein
MRATEKRLTVTRRLKATHSGITRKHAGNPETEIQRTLISRQREAG